MNGSTKFIKVITLLIIFLSLAIIVKHVYGDFMGFYFRLAMLSEYSYILLLLPIAIAVFIKVVLDRFQIVGANLVRVFTFTMFISISILLYTLANLVIGNVIEFITLSFIFLLWGILTLFLSSRSYVSAFLTMSIFLLLIPIPRSLINELLMTLTSIIAKIVSILTNSALSISTNYPVLSTIDNLGMVRSFEINPMSSGVITLTFIIAITPLIGYLVSRSTAPTTKKLGIGTVSILIAISAVLLGNITRLVLAILITKYWGYEIGLIISHYTLSVICIAIAITISIYLCTKLPSKSVDTEVERGIVKIDIRWVVSVILAMLITIIYPYASLITLQSTIMSNVSPVISLPNFFNESIIVNTDIPNTSIPKLNELMKASIVKSFTLNHKGCEFSGYLEIDEDPTKFSNWYIYLTLQGYRITGYWSEISNVTINYILLSKGSENMLIGYTIYNYPTEMKNAVFARVSLLTSVNSEKNCKYVASIIRSLLNNVEVSNGFKVTNSLEYVILAINMSIVINLILMILSMVGKRLSNVFRSSMIKS